MLARSARLVLRAARGRVATVLFSLNLLRARTGRAWRAIHGREAVAEALGINVTAAKLSAFVVSCTLTSIAGCLFAYYRGFVSAEAFSLFLTIQYVAMVIIGGIGSILGALLGTVFVVLFPYAIEALMTALGLAERYVLDDLRGQLRRLRPGDDPVPRLRAAGPGRHLAPRAGLVPAVAVQAEAGRQMTEAAAASWTRSR